MKRLITTFSALALIAVSLMAEEKGARMLAHRGGRTEFDQNTMYAFQEATKAGCTAFETDIRMTKDGVLVVFHDGNTKNLTGVDASIETLTAAEIRKMKTLQGNKILFFDELMEFLNKYDDLYVEFELKCSSYDPQILPEYCDKVYKAVHAAKPGKSLYIISSFDVRALSYLKIKHPDTELMLIASKPCDKERVELCKLLGVKRMAVMVGKTTREGMELAHKEGIKVNLWPGSKVQDTLLAYQLGADYLCTDIPVEVIKYIKENNLPIRY